MPPPNTIHLQLPVLTPLEPLTSGTNLPHVPAEELTPTSSSPSSPRDNQTSTQTPQSPTTTATTAATTTPPQSPNRPTSMRRFLSRVSLNSSYHGSPEDDDKASVLSGPLSPTGSVMSRDTSKRKISAGSLKGKTSWWKKAKNQPAEGGNAGKRQTVQSIAPPPKLPDDLFGSGFSSLDSDMFRNFK